MFLERKTKRRAVRARAPARRGRERVGDCTQSRGSLRRGSARGRRPRAAPWAPRCWSTGSKPCTTVGSARVARPRWNRNVARRFDKLGDGPEMKTPPQGAREESPCNTWRDTRAQLNINIRIVCWQFKQQNLEISNVMCINQMRSQLLSGKNVHQPNMHQPNVSQTKM